MAFIVGRSSTAWTDDGDQDRGPALLRAGRDRAVIVHRFAMVRTPAPAAHSSKMRRTIDASASFYAPFDRVRLWPCMYSNLVSKDSRPSVFCSATISTSNDRALGAAQERLQPRAPIELGAGDPVVDVDVLVGDHPALPSIVRAGVGVARQAVVNLDT